MAVTKPIAIKVKRVNMNAKLPIRSDGDAGWDFYAPKDYVIDAGQAAMVCPTGIAFEFPKGYYLELFMRSSTAKKTTLRLSNQVGVVDSTYRGEVVALFDNVGRTPYTIKKGERFIQGIIKKEVPTVLEEAEDLTPTERGTGGFGSTGA